MLLISSFIFLSELLKIHTDATDHITHTSATESMRNDTEIVIKLQDVLCITQSEVVVVMENRHKGNLKCFPFTNQFATKEEMKPASDSPWPESVLRASFSTLMSLNDRYGIWLAETCAIYHKSFSRKTIGSKKIQNLGSNW